MITGGVSGALTPWIQLIVRGPDGRALPINFIVDTGYNGYISLPARDIAALSLAQVGEEKLTFADGSVANSPLYEAVLLWDGGERDIIAHLLDDDPLLGTSMMYDYDLHIGFVNGGLVTLQRRP